MFLYLSCSLLRSRPQIISSEDVRGVNELQRCRGTGCCDRMIIVMSHSCGPLSYYAGLKSRIYLAFICCFYPQHQSSEATRLLTYDSDVHHRSLALSLAALSPPGKVYFPKPDGRFEIFNSCCVLVFEAGRKPLVDSEQTQTLYSCMELLLLKENKELKDEVKASVSPSMAETRRRLRHSRHLEANEAIVKEQNDSLHVLLEEE